MVQLMHDKHNSGDIDKTEVNSIAMLNIRRKIDWKIYAERPGLFNISLNASQNPPSHQITHRIKVMETLIRAFPMGFSNRASRNLLGVLYFYSGKFARSVQTFQDILQFQHDSLTTVANLAFVYRRLKQTSKSTKYLAELTTLKKEDNKETQSIALADQAFAFFFDCYMEMDLIERNKLPSELFQQSLLILEDSKEYSKETVIEIKYWLSQSYFRLFSNCPGRKGMKDMEKEFYLKGLKELADIIQVADTTETCVCTEIASTTWAFIGLFLSQRGRIQDKNGDFKSKTIEEMDDEIKDNLKLLNLFQYLDDPEECFRKGLEQSLKNKCRDNGEPPVPTELFIRYAIFLKKNEKYEEALEKLNEALKIDHTQGNWFALAVRSEVLEMLNRIDDSIADRELACSWNPTPRGLCGLAKAYHSKYKSCEDQNSEIAEEFLLKASDCFSRAVQLLGQEKRPEIFSAHGRFLKDIGEIKEAIECFKRAMEIDTTQNNTNSFFELFETLLQYYRNSVDAPNESQSDRGKILHEMAYFYETALRKHGKLTDETENFHKGFEKEMAMLTAYFKHQRPDAHINGKNISDIISSHVKSDIQKWHTLVEENVCFYKTVIKSSSDIKRTNVLCRNCRSQVFTRQPSIFPYPRERPRSLIYDYDFYVIFSAEDRDWVCHMLLEILENSYGYKGMIPERDILPGTIDLYQRVKWIHNCSKILVILSQDFEKNPESEYELSLALNRKHEEKLDNFLIPIVRKVNGIHRSLRTITVLDAVDDCDWNKLINAIEST